MSNFEPVLSALLLPTSPTALLATIAVVWLATFLPPVVIRTRRLPVHARGLAFLNIILIRDTITSSSLPSYDRVYRHEFEHVRQMRRYSPWGCALFLGGWYFWNCVVRKRPFAEAWATNPLELQAERGADR